MGLLYNRNEETTTCVRYSDVNWAGDFDDGKSMSNYVFQISNAVISWRSKKRSCVALSTTEAEYIALASATQEAGWLLQLLTNLKSKLNGPMLIFEDNQAGISMAKYVQSILKLNMIIKATVKLECCSSQEMIADIFTKALSAAKYDEICIPHMNDYMSILI